jgi:hypothetical protein
VSQNRLLLNNFGLHFGDLRDMRGPCVAMWPESAHGVRHASRGERRPEARRPRAPSPWRLKRPSSDHLERAVRVMPANRRRTPKCLALMCLATNTQAERMVTQHKKPDRVHASGESVHVPFCARALCSSGARVSAKQGRGANRGRPPECARCGILRHKHVRASWAEHGR